MATTRRSRGRWRRGCSKRWARPSSSIAAGAVKSDPALLVDEAGAMSLFGGKRADLDRAGDQGHRGRRRRRCSRPGDRKPGRRDRRRAAEDVGAAQAGRRLAAARSPIASYAPEGQDAERMVIDLGRRFGLKVSAAGRGADRRQLRATTRRSSRRSCRSSRCTSTRRRKRPRSSTMTRSTRSAPTAPKAISCGSPISRWRRSRRARRRAGAAAGRRIGGDPGRPLAAAAAADAGAGAGPGRARRARRRRHGVTRQSRCSGRIKPRSGGCCRSGARRIWRRSRSAPASSSAR